MNAASQAYLILVIATFSAMAISLFATWAYVNLPDRKTRR